MGETSTWGVVTTGHCRHRLDVDTVSNVYHLALPSFITTYLYPLTEKQIKMPQKWVPLEASPEVS